jgi:hypothetical protein
MSAIRNFLEHDGAIEKTAGNAPVSFGVRFGQAAGKAAIMAGGTALSYGIMEAISAAKNAVSRSRGYKEMLRVNPELQEMDAEGVKAMYSMMHKTAPTMAQNPYISGGFVKRIEHGKKWMDPRIVSDLAETEAKMQRASYGPATGFPFEFGKAMAGM